MLALFNRRVGQNPLCPLCKESPESTEHALFLCPWTIGVWFASSLNYRVDRSSITTFDEWFLALQRVVDTNADSLSWVYTTVSFICWEIWKARCSYTFNGSVPSSVYAAEKASRMAAEFIKAGLGVVFRSSNGALLNGVSCLCLSSSSLQSEAKATLLAVRPARDNNVREFHSISWRWVPRQANCVADWVASHCKRGMCSDAWVIRPPSSLVHIFSKDGLPCPS
ncbi:hypothetical protein ACFX19_002501 [Malus domestica]